MTWLALKKMQLMPVPDKPGVYFAVLKELCNDKFRVCENVPEDKLVFGFGYSDTNMRERVGQAES